VYPCFLVMFLAGISANKFRKIVVFVRERFLLFYCFLVRQKVQIEKFIHKFVGVEISDRNLKFCMHKISGFDVFFLICFLFNYSLF